MNAVRNAIICIGVMTGMMFPAGAAVPAFPGAEGFGAMTPGGRGGRLIEVTNLNDSGPGSLRAACEAEGPRIVVFRVGGTIELESDLNVTNAFLTIAAQTAPGGGITLRNRSLGVSKTHDVVIRYLRVRPGPRGLGLKEAHELTARLREKKEQLIEKHGKKGWMAHRRELYDLGGTVGLDCIGMVGARNVVIDHCSVSWGIDENVQLYSGCRDVTVQWSITSEALRDSIHIKGSHSMGFIIGGPNSGTTNISLHHNLFAHNHWRNPRVQNGTVDMVNNIVYDTCGYQDAWKADNLRMNVVGNTWIPGPSATHRFVPFTFRGLGIHVLDNIAPQRPNPDIQQELIVREDQRRFITPQRFETPPVTTLPAAQAYEKVLAEVGAVLPRRDSVDARIVTQVRSRRGRFIDHPEEVGGWPELAGGRPPSDTDRDGMPDVWERRYGLNPGDGSDGSQDADGDIYTNVEEWLNGTNPRKPE